MDTFTTAYIECAIWADSPEGADCYDDIDLSPELLTCMISDCRLFQTSNKELLEEAYDDFHYTKTQAGHDFWLTRNSHGAGFWDRGLAHVGSHLTEKAKACGSYGLFVGDGGMVHGERM